MYSNISFIDYFKQKYNIPNLDIYIGLLYLSLMASIIIYASTHFKIIQMTIVIFMVLLLITYVINQYYMHKYNDNLSFITSKLDDITTKITTISKNDNINDTTINNK